MMRAALVCGLMLAVGAAALMPSKPAHGHALAPSLLALRESGEGRIEVLWKTPLIRPTGTELRPIVSAVSGGCAPLGRVETAVEAGGAVATWSVDCVGSDATALHVAVEGLARSRTDAIVRVEFLDGRRFDALLTAGAPARQIPSRSSRFDVAADYVTLGFSHILAGLDHLLFVFGLLLLVRGPRMLVATITSFTLGHSVTLTLAALGWVRYPTGLVELAIAASLVVLAVEISGARRQRTSRSRLSRHPWALALGFGLLHGFGFAGALQQVGLPGDALPLALATFNLGIELGQLAFVAAVGVAGAGLRWASGDGWERSNRFQLLASYAIGSLAFYWCFDRAAALL